MGAIGAAIMTFAAHASDETVSAMLSCKAVADDRERLQCLDAALATVKPVAGPVTRPATQASLEERERELARREARLNAKSETVNNAASLFGVTSSSGGADSFTVAVARLAEQDVVRDTDGVVEAMSANIREWSHNSRGQISVVLDNGQVWRQTDNVGLHLSTGRMKPHRVRIARSVFGSFTMTVDGNNQGYKVRRVTLQRADAATQ